MTIFDLFKNALLAGYGAQEKVKEIIDELVKKGEVSESQGAKLVKEWSEKADKSTTEFSQSIADIISGILDKMNLPSKDDIERIEKSINTLTSRVKILEEEKKD